MARSGLRNLCCEAIGQASAFNMISSKISDMTQEEIDAIKETSRLLQTTLTKMLKKIQEDDAHEIKTDPAHP